MMVVTVRIVGNSECTDDPCPIRRWKNLVLVVGWVVLRMF